MSAAIEILIVDDSPTQAMLLNHLLMQHGYVVRTAGNGKEGLAAARQHKPKLIISDVLMPEMDGYQMCHAIKQDPALAGISVILLTTLSEAQDVVRGLEANADYYINKPFDEKFLLSKVELLGADSAAQKTSEPVQTVELVLAGKPYVVSSNRQQILNLLLSTYENAIQQNRELIRAQSSERAAHEELKKAQSHLVQTEKLSGLGQMVAGIAHEINNPLSFVLNNVAVLQRDMEALGKLLALYHQGDAALAGQQPELFGQIREIAERIDIDYTLENLHGLFVRSREGLDRIRRIVADLRDFSRLDTSDLSDVDLNAGVQSTINIIQIRAQQKQVTIQQQLSPLPQILCYPAKINQVIMNLVANAIDACHTGGTVIVRTLAKEKTVEIQVQDDGIGIDPAICNRIFDPFFTTKPQGEGTGLGLSISYGIVRDHGGQIDVHSELGKGSTFTIILPRSPSSKLTSKATE